MNQGSSPENCWPHRLLLHQFSTTLSPSSDSSTNQIAAIITNPNTKKDHPMWDLSLISPFFRVFLFYFESFWWWVFLWKVWRNHVSSVVFWPITRAHRDRPIGAHQARVSEYSLFFSLSLSEITTQETRECTERSQIDSYIYISSGSYRSVSTHFSVRRELKVPRVFDQATKQKKPEIFCMWYFWEFFLFLKGKFKKRFFAK